MADWPSSDDHWADIPSWGGGGWADAGQDDTTHNNNGWGQAKEEAPPRKRNVGAGFFGSAGQQAAPYPAHFTAFNSQNHPNYGLNHPHSQSHPSSFGPSSYGQSHKQYAKLIAPYRTTEAPYKTSAAPYQPQNTPFDLGPVSYSKPPSPYSFSHQPYKSHFQPTPIPYSTPAAPPPYSRPPYNPKANYRPAIGNSLAPLRVTPPDFGSNQFEPQRQQPEKEGTSSGGQSPKERPSVFERSVQGQGGRSRGRDRPGRGLAPPGPGRPEQGQGQGLGSGRQQRPLRTNFPPGRPRPPPFTNRAVIPFRDLRRPQQQKRKPNPNAIVGNPFAPIDPSFDFANDFKEFEAEASEEGDVEDEFFQDSDDNPFGRPGFPGSHHEPNSRGGSPKKAQGFQGPGFDGQELDEFGFDGEGFEEEELDSDGFERNGFEERGFGGRKEKEGNKGKRENLEMGMRRKRKKESEVEAVDDGKPLDFRYSTIGLELFKASRGAEQKPRKPTYREPYRQPNTQPTNLPQSG